MERKKRIVIIGGGFAGLNVLHEIKKSDCEIILIDKCNHHTFQPLLYQVATATISPNDICTSFRDIFHKNENISIIMGEVVTIEKEKSNLTLRNGDVIDYDYLVVAVGSRHSYFGKDEFERHARGLKTIDDALYIRNQLLSAFERAERDPSKADGHTTFTIVGGGPTGIELAGTISELIAKTLRGNFRKLQLNKAKIILVEGMQVLLPQFHESLSIRTKKDLESMNVEIMTNSFVTNVNENGIYIGDTFIESKTILWAAGNTIPTVVNSLNVSQDKSGRVLVDPSLAIPGNENIFVIGDCAHYKWNNEPLPALAPAAIQQGKFLGKLLSKKLEKKPFKKTFKYFDKGALAVIGVGKAVGSFSRFKFKGTIAWTLWAVIHVVYLISFRNRVSVTISWIMNYATGKRNSRIIVGELD